MTWNNVLIFELPVDFSAMSYKATLARACRALRREAWAEAEAWLMQAGAIAGDDAVFFNLVGVLREVQGDKVAAKLFYGKAIRADSNYQPGQQNMRRLYELQTFGNTSQTVALGDEIG